MTVYEIADIASVSPDTVKRKIKELYPALMENGKKTRLSQPQAIAVMAEIRKPGFIQPTQDAQVPTQNAQVMALVEMVKAQSANIDKLGAMVAAMLQRQDRGQIAAPSHYSIMGYAAMKHRPIDSTDARKLAYQARGICAEKGLEVHKVGDERYGEVNSYPLAVLEEVFS